MNKFAKIGGGLILAFSLMGAGYKTYVLEVNQEQRISALEMVEYGREYDNLIRTLRSEGTLNRGDRTKLCYLAELLYQNPRDNGGVEIC